MKDFDLLRFLQAHTGNLQPASGVTHAELNELRRLVMLSVSSGQSPDDIGPADELTQSLDTPLLKELEWLASTEALAAPRLAESFRIARRDFGLGGPLTAEWARGLEAAQTLGPFVDEFGRHSWFDLFLIPKQFRVSRGNELLLVLPPGTTKRPNEQVLTVPAGTVWIRANQLTSGVPPTAWTGVRVKGGQIEIPPGGNLTNNALVIDVASPLDLQIELDPPSATGPASGPGSEATNAVANLPPTTRFIFGPLGVESIETGAASLSLYGNNLTFTRNATPQSFEPTLRMVLISMDVDRANLDINVAQSKLFQPAGSAPIEKAAWGLPVTISQPDQLGVAEGAGSLVLIIKAGLTGTWNGLPVEQTSLGNALIAVSPLSLILLAQKATNFRGKQTFELWQETASRRSTIDVQFPRPFFFSFISSRNGLDSVAFQSQLTAHLDRPVRVDGSRFPVDMNGMVILLENSTGTTIAMDANAPAAARLKPMAVALTNGLVTITPVQRLLLNGTLLNNVNIDKGTLTITSGIYQVLPILPDPYAANFEPRRTQDSPLTNTVFRAVVTWPDPPRPSLEIALESQNADLTEMLPKLRPAGREFGRDRGVGTLHSLLDVSTGADQLGVAMGIPQGLTVQNLSIHYPLDRLATFLLPQFQWEPIKNTENKLTGDTDKDLVSHDDGPPSLIHSDSVHLVPVAPVPVLREVVRSYKDAGANVDVNFTLPFGMTASAVLRDRRYIVRPSLEILREGFGPLRAAQQISLSAGSHLNLRRSILGLPALEPVLFGTTVQEEKFSTQPNNTLGQLKEDFNTSFTREIPIQRIEFSGYGASIFSRWVRPGDPDIGITQVSFDAFNGRTAFERILMVSYLWPCLSRVIRTIVVERQGNGSVLRWDSGWIATTPGFFSLEKKFDRIHKGDIDGMYDIREIRDTPQIMDVPGAALQAVYYDADLAFATIDGLSPVESGQNGNGRVPVRRQLGFIQRIALPRPDPPPVSGTINQIKAALLEPEQFDALLTKVGPIGGPIDCSIRIGKSQQRKRVTLIQTERGGIDDTKPVFAVPLYGSPVIRGSGQWSVVSVDNASKTVQPVDMKRGVPLIKRKDREYRWADAIDLMNEGAGQRDYAFLMAHDAQRFLLQRPKIEANESNISSNEPPRVADPYSMLESSGLFPRVDQAIELPETELVAETLKLATSNGTLTRPVTLGKKVLVNLPAWTERVDFNGAKLFIDSANNWKINLSGLKQTVDFGPITEIMTLVHDFESVADQTSKILEPRVVFSTLLANVADVLEMLNKLAPDGGVGPFKVNPQFHGTTFKLEIVADFKLATKDEDQIDCGMGKVRGNLKVGAELTADLVKRQIGGAVFLEISGSYQQLIFPAIYGGGHLRFFIRADHDGKTHLELDACVVGSIGGTLIPHLVELEATVKYGYYIQVTSKPLPGVIVGMEGRAKLLSGLLGFKFGVEGRALIDPNLPIDPNSGEKIRLPDLEERAVTLYGRIRVAGTVTLAWAIKESKSFETEFNVEVTWKTAFMLLKAGLLPVP